MKPADFHLNLSITAVLIVVLSIVCSCNRTRNIPFPEDGGYAPPGVTAITFGPEEPIIWSGEPRKLTSNPSPFPFGGLPLVTFDTMGFQPLVAPPDTMQVDLAGLRSVPFDFEKLPDHPLRIVTNLTRAPERIPVPRPQVKRANEVSYDFPAPLNAAQVGSMATDPLGRTWFMTSMGLICYDGETLIRYEGNLNLAYIQSMTIDKNGNIWFANRRNGVCRFEPANAVVRIVIGPADVPSTSANNVSIDSRGFVWCCFLPQGFKPEDAAHNGCVVRVDPDAGTYKIMTEADGLIIGRPSSVAEDKDHNYWISTASHGLQKMDRQKKVLSSLGHAAGLSTDTIIAITAGQNGQMIISGLYSTLDILSPHGKIRKFGPRQGIARLVNGDVATTDSHDNVVRNTSQGIYLLKADGSAMKMLRRADGLNSAIDAFLFEDARHQLIAGTASGVNMFRKNGLDIRRMGTAQISTMLEDTRGRIWIGTTEQGIQILDRNSNQYRLYDQAHGLRDNFIQYMTEYDGRVLICSQTGGMEIIDTALTKIQRIGGLEGVVENLTTIEADQDKNIWLGGFGKGVDVIDFHNNTVRHLGAAEGIADSSMIELKRDKKGRIWFYSVTGGVGYIDPVKKTIRHIIKSEAKVFTGDNQDCLIRFDATGNIWLLTNSRGFFMIKNTLDSVLSFGPAQGILANTGSALNEYNGRMYLGCGVNGLNIVTPPATNDDKWKVETISKSAGLSKTVRTYNSDLITRSGEYWWGDDGVTLMKNLEQGITDTLAYETYITGIDADGHSLYFVDDPRTGMDKNDTLWSVNGDKRTSYTDGAFPAAYSWLKHEGLTWDSLDGKYNVPVNPVFPYDRNVLQFHFAQAHLGSQDSVYYRYVLLGFDQRWSEKTTKTSTEYYRNIPPGKYTFKVASSNRGIWGKPVEYHFTINPPWWRTWWAYLLYTVVLIAALRAYIVYRSARLRRENKVLEEKIGLRTQQLQQSIEELKATQSQLVQSEKMASLGELTAGIAHEIQNPLNFINNFSEVNKELLVELAEEMDKGNIEEAKGLAKDVISNEEKINHHGRRADGIVKSMLQHSRGSNAAVREPTDLNKLADEYLRLAYHGLRAKDKSFNATMKTDFDERVGLVSVMANDMGRVILNLITNAFYAVGEKKREIKTGYEPTVTVASVKQNGKIELRITDNGKGIPDRVIEKIFQPFFTTKPAGQGTGLGLSLAYDIVKAHGGELKVTTTEGEGTAFTIILPA